ncbi:MAG: methyltransferase [Chloroflexi bacterium]|nr:methyltransferase [Chloroflexota bacterium]
MTTTDAKPPLVLEQLIHGFMVTQCLYVAATLGIADLLKDGPRHFEDLAQATNTHAPSLYHVLRLLTTVDLLTEAQTHSFALTPLGTYLQTDVAGSMRHLVRFYGQQTTWRVWGALLHSVQTGEPSYGQVWGVSNREYRAQHPEAAALFDQYMTEWAARLAPTVEAAYDFSTTSTLVDVGGGQGHILATILQAHPRLRGVLLDLPPVVAGAPPLLEAAGVADRCEVVGGDAFTAVPAGYEIYLLSRVLLPYDDDHALTILTRCQQAMQPRGKLLLVEPVILTEQAPNLLGMEADVHMLVITGGRERTEAEYRALLQACGFELTQLTAVLTPFYLIEAVRL